MNIDPNNIQAGLSASQPGEVGNLSASGITSRASEITDLTALTTTVTKVFYKENEDVIYKCLGWGTLSIIGIGFIVYYFVLNICITEYNVPFFLKSEKLTLIAGYEITVRITFISLVISLTVFCIKMMRNYLSMYEHIRHKIVLLESMPTLVLATGNRDISKTAYNKILEMVISLDNIDKIKNEDININSLMEILKKLPEKDK